MEIRKETASDYDAVYQVVRDAFASAEERDGNEQDLVAKLRSGPSLVLSLVAVEKGKILGHILFTRAEVDGHPVLALAPLSVLPEYQRRGIGLALMAEGHRTVQALGYDYSIVLGHEDYYPKAGYRPASEYGIKPPFAVPDQNFMALKLNPAAQNLNGTMRYDLAFGI